MAPKKTLIAKWRGNELDEFDPVRVVATIEARCNLACLHCYWAHDMKFKSADDWTGVVSKIKQMNKPLLYAGRILGKTGAEFLKECVRQKVGFSIIDNGYTILTQPDFLPLYRDINISLDGWRDAHDVQRGRAGAFDKAWSTVLELKKQGFDPTVSAAFSPLSFEGWERFEELLAKHDVPLSSTLVLSLPETAKRGSAVLQGEEMIQKAFDKLRGGIPKLINLYANEHVAALRPFLKGLEWSEDQFEGDGLVATLGNKTTIIYRPPSIEAVGEAALHWDGKFYAAPVHGPKVPLSKIDSSYLAEVKKANAVELECWNGQ